MGLALGFGSWIRPLDALIAAVLMGLWSLGWGGKRLKSGALAGLVLATAGSGAGTLYYNHLFTGSVTSFPIQAYMDRHYGPNSNAFGFGADPGFPWQMDPYPGHGLRDVVVNTNLNLFSVNVELFGWSIGSLLVVALLLFGRGGRGADFGMVFTIVAVIGALSFYWFSGGPDFGARYWYLAIVPLTALTARGIEFLKELLERSGPQGAPDGTRIHLAVVTLCGLTLVNYLPWRAIDKYFHYLGMRPEIGRLAEEYDFRESLVLVRRSFSGLHGGGILQSYRPWLREHVVRVGPRARAPGSAVRGGPPAPSLGRQRADHHRARLPSRAATPVPPFEGQETCGAQGRDNVQEPLSNSRPE